MTMPEINGLKTYLAKLAAWLSVLLVGQTVGLIWWASAINTRMLHVERDVSKVEARLLNLETHP